MTRLFTLLIWVCFAISMAVMPAAQATRLSPELTAAAQKVLASAKPRLDGAMQTAKGDLYVLLLLPDAEKKAGGKVELAETVPASGTPDLIIYSNGWAHARVEVKGEARTISWPLTALSEKQKKHLLGMRFPSDLIVPEGFVLPRSLKPLIAAVPTISLLDDAIILAPEFGQKRKAITRENYKGPGSIFCTSVTSGSVTMLDGKSLTKLAEFPTEGTPAGMELVNGQLYVVDQAKNRILILDPAARRFTGQIDLEPKTAPKGIAALPNGKWLYVSESGTSDIAVVELDNGKGLMRTRVRPGPGRIALTPDGNFLVILNVTSGECSFLSTYNQKIVSSLKVGDMPSALAISKDGKLVYVANRMSNNVVVIDVPTRKIVATIKTSQSPTALALSLDNTRLYVVSGRENTLTVFDTTSKDQLHQMQLPNEIEFPGAACLLPGGDKLLVCGSQGDGIGVIDLTKMEMVQRISVGHAQHQILWVPAP